MKYEVEGFGEKHFQFIFVKSVQESIPSPGYISNQNDLLYVQPALPLLSQSFSGDICQPYLLGGKIGKILAA